ncbi:hypothetical protein Trydic_g15146 [Trypoxylus dichotomus]
MGGRRFAARAFTFPNRLAVRESLSAERQVQRDKQTAASIFKRWLEISISMFAAWPVTHLPTSFVVESFLFARISNVSIATGTSNNLFEAVIN